MRQSTASKRDPRIKLNTSKKTASIVGIIFTFSSIKWKVQSQTLQDVWYVVRLGTNSLIWECPANTGGKKICQHSFAIHRFLKKSDGTGRAKRYEYDGMN